MPSGWTVIRPDTWAMTMIIAGTATTNVAAATIATSINQASRRSLNSASGRPDGLTGPRPGRAPGYP